MKTQMLVVTALLGLAQVARASGTAAPTQAPEYREAISGPDVNSGELIGPRVAFEHPIVLNAKTIPVLIARQETEFQAASNQFVERSNTTETRYCNMRIAVQGRDIALNNQKLGEHYFGKMQMSCAADGWGQREFTTTFSRVFVLGIRNCVESETMIDQDYCNLYVIALRRKNDVSLNNGDLIQDTGNYLDKYLVTSPEAYGNVVNGGFMPSGLNPELFDSVQTFKLSIGKRAGDYFIPATSGTTGIGGGRSYNLEVSQDIERQNQVEGIVTGNLTRLNQMVAAVRNAPQPLDAFNAQSAEYFKLYASTAKTLLEVILPVSFYRLEAQLKAIESQVIDMLKGYDASIKDRDTLLTKYASALGAYEKIRGYYTENAQRPAIDYEALLQSSRGSGGGRRVGKKDMPLIGQMVTDYNQDQEGSKRDAAQACKVYIIKHTDMNNTDETKVVVEDYKCTFVRTFFNDNGYWYSQFKIEAN